MKLIVTHSYEESSALCAELMNEVFIKNPSGFMGLATGTTPISVYKNMAKAQKAGAVNYSSARCINLDEYIGVAQEDKNSYMYYMKENLFAQVGISPENVYIPNGMYAPEQEIERLNSYLDSNEIDIQLLSVGTNGHIGFNEPSDIFYDKYHVVALTEETRKSNARLFDSIDEVPAEATTMGVGGIMKAKKIAFLATGKEKLFAMKAILEEGNVTPRVQGTILKFHKNCIIFLDKELAEQIVSEHGVEVTYC